MNGNITSLLLFCAISLFAPSAASAVTINTVPVGNPGNAADTTSMLTDGTFGYGAVAYAYRIGTTEVTNAQYVAFLNAKAVSDPLALYHTAMASDSRGGISRGGVSGSFTYAAKTNMDNKPVNYVSWYDSIRFINWLNNGQGNGDTETGAYTLGPLDAFGTPANGLSITRNAAATWFLPSENEWYKAAYYQPTAQGGDVDNYWLYATKSNSDPTIATANGVGDISNPGANVANYLAGADWNGRNGNVTTVGSAGPLSNNFYGTADQDGNVREWNEGVISGVSRGSRGGAFDNGAAFDDIIRVGSRWRTGQVPTFGDAQKGFRVALVPEPSSFVLAALGLIGLVVWRLRKR